MKHLLKALTVAAVVAAPVAGNAQPLDPFVSVSLLSHPHQTTGTGYSGTGGGFRATFTVNTQTFTNYLVWCIDPNRNVAPPATYNYAAYTLAGYVGDGLMSANGHAPDMADLTRIASLVNTFEDSFGAMSATVRQHTQGGIWANYRNEVAPAGYEGNAGFDASDFYILHGLNGNQTFMFKAPDLVVVTPEPATYALMAFGLVGVLAMRRRLKA